MQTNVNPCVDHAYRRNVLQAIMGMARRPIPYLFLLGMLVMLGHDALAQAGRIVTGLVKDELGAPLAGITVSVRGTTRAVVTGADGKFSINVPSNASVLNFSHVGMVNISRPVGNLKTVDIVMKAESGSLEEVVVVGYGQVRKKDLTGSVGTVDVTELQKAPINSIDQGLAGRVAGVYVVSGDGQPGDNAEITIRGVGSVTQSSAPLYVIDGFPQEDANFNSINPAEVESIEILKDASATAIYGARGSNGVIIITTKRGKSPKPVINYSGYYGVQDPIKKMELMNPYEFVKLQNEINPLYTNAVFFTKDKTLEDYRNATPIDWQDLMFVNSPAFHKNFVSLSAKVNKTAYTFSGGYEEMEGLIINSGFKRYQGRFTLDQDINNKLKVGGNVNYSVAKSYGQVPSVQNRPVGSVVTDASWNLMTNIWGFRPVLSSNATDESFIYDDIQDYDQEEGGIPGGRRFNPYVQAQNEKSERATTTLNANGYLQYKFNNNFTWRSTLGVNLTNGESYNFYNSKTTQGNPLAQFGQLYGVNASTSSNKGYSFVNENTLNYNKAIRKKDYLNIVVGATWQKNTGSSNGFRATNLPNEALGIHGIGQGTPFSISSGSSINSIRSYLGRLNYSWLDKYLFTASFRADGTSKFHPDNRWGFFPSGAFAWKAGNERFLGSLKGTVDNLKLRVSLGATGNNRVGDFAYSSLLTTNSGLNSGSLTTFNNQIAYNLIVTQMANANLRWEKGIQMDGGVDFSMLKNRLAVTVDVYRRITSDLLLNGTVPYHTGFTNSFNNVGRVSNQGLEISLNSDNLRKGKFRWTTSFNISFNQNELEALNNGEDQLLTHRNVMGAGFNNSGFNFIAKVGRPVAQMYGLIFDGVYQYEDFYKLPNGANNVVYILKENIPYWTNKNYIDAPNTSTTNTLQPGDAKYRDLNGDGVINMEDYTVIGNPYPKHFGGVNNNFSYKNLELSVFLQWSYGNEVYNMNRTTFEGGTGSARAANSSSLTDGYINMNQFASFNNRWTPENPSNTIPRANPNATGARFYSSRFVEDASYLRVKTVQFAYNLPVSLAKRLKIVNAKFYVAAQNLLTFTKYTGPDPEVSLGTNNLTPGFDYSPYPRTRIITVGANLSL